MNIQRLTFAINTCAVRPALIVLPSHEMVVLLKELLGVATFPDASLAGSGSKFLGIPLVEAAVEGPLLLLPDGNSLAIA